MIYGEHYIYIYDYILDLTYNYNELSGNGASERMEWRFCHETCQFSNSIHMN